MTDFMDDDDDPIKTITIRRDYEQDRSPVYQGQHRDLRECLEFIARENRRADQEEKKRVLERVNMTLFMPLGDQLAGANLSGIRMPRTTFKDANFHGARFRKADLSNSTFRNCDLSGADFSGANLIGIDLRGSNITGVNLSGAQIGYASIEGCDFRGVEFRGTNFHPLTLINCPSITPFKSAVQSVVKLATDRAAAVVEAVDGGQFDGADPARDLFAILQIKRKACDPEAVTLVDQFCRGVTLGAVVQGRRGGGYGVSSMAPSGNGFAWCIREWADELAPKEEAEPVRLPGIGLMGQGKGSETAKKPEPAAEVRYEIPKLITADEDRRNRAITARRYRAHDRSWIT